MQTVQGGGIMFLIKEFREKQGITQEQLAEDLDITRPYLTDIENGQRTPSLTLLEKIAKSLNTSIKELIQE